MQQEGFELQNYYNKQTSSKMTIIEENGQRLGQKLWKRPKIIEENEQQAPKIIEENDQQTLKIIEENEQQVTKIIEENDQRTLKRRGGKVPKSCSEHCLHPTIL